MNNLLCLKNVSFSYDRPILESVNFELPAGKVIAITGKADSGKSVFLRVAAGILSPDEGDLILFGKNFWELGRPEMMRLKMRTAFFFQEGALLANTNVFDNLALPLRYHFALDQKKVESKVGFVLERLGMLKYSKQLPASLSLQLKRRVALARVLLAESSKIYFWDEPEVMEEEMREIVAETIKEAKAKGIPSLITGNGAWTKGLSDGGRDVF